MFNVQLGGVFQPPPRPDFAVFFTRLAEFKRRLAPLLPSTIPWTLTQFVGSYTGDRRRKVYQQAVDSLIDDPLTESDAMLRVFVKAEKINMTVKLGEHLGYVPSEEEVEAFLRDLPAPADPAPRVISPRHPRYNASIGCYLKPIEHRVYRAIGKIFGHPTVMKGYNAHDLGAVVAAKWGAFTRPCGIGLDAKRFDQHISRVALAWEHSVYRLLYPHDPWFAWLCQLQLQNRGIGACPDGVLRFLIEGCRMSGDMNTALGNCLIMCALVWTWAATCHVDIQLINNGDDCVVFCEQDDEVTFTTGLSAWFVEMGFTMKIENISYDLEKVVFCQTQPVWTPTGYVMVRDPRVAISKDCCSIKPLDTPTGAAKYLEVFSKGGMSLTGGIPVWQEFYGVLGRHDVQTKASRIVLETGMAHLARGMSRYYSDVDPRSRYSFWLAFDISPDEQLVIESHYRATKLDIHNVQTARHPLVWGDWPA
jgi:hypothetical protein